MELHATVHYAIICKNLRKDDKIMKKNAWLILLSLALCLALSMGCALAENVPDPADREAALRSLLSGKKVSILGDSISTFQGYSNNTDYNPTIGNNAIYYTGAFSVTNVNQTWWMKAINRIGGQLHVNNSWSGDRVVTNGVTRATQLHDSNGVPPDIIAIYLGINDFRTGVQVNRFKATYNRMLTQMKKAYPNADIFLLTLVYSTNPHEGVDPDNVIYHNAVIEEMAEKHGCVLVDLYNDSGITKQNLAANMCDGGLHPNEAGMEKMAQCLLNAMMDYYLPAAPAKE
ncbi:MAG: SGNH/GDSL hydrolase family protein [Clostridiales bacterium]|nr:SGNH/GDSL hydrolase family protein [Clostridiales bacterium]